MLTHIVLFNVQFNTPAAFPLPHKLNSQVLRLSHACRPLFAVTSRTMRCNLVLWQFTSNWKGDAESLQRPSPTTSSERDCEKRIEFGTIP